jgi:hypothetical protein
MDPGRPALSCGLQALGLSSTWGAPVTVRQHLLRWRGELRPSSYSRTYLVEVRYRLGHHPDVAVRKPDLEPNAEGWLPHYFHHNDTLCLYDEGEWHPTMHLARTILPWTVEWLFHYEIWKVTGLWHGSGDNMAWANVTPLADFESSKSHSVRRGRRTRSRRAA